MGDVAGESMLVKYTIREKVEGYLAIYREVTR